jgi:hypothetical protein
MAFGMQAFCSWVRRAVVDVLQRDSSRMLALWVSRTGMGTSMGTGMSTGAGLGWAGGSGMRCVRIRTRPRTR